MALIPTTETTTQKEDLTPAALTVHSANTDHIIRAGRPLCPRSPGSHSVYLARTK